MAPDHLGLTGTQTSTPGGGQRKSLRHILADAFPCTTAEQPSTTASCTRAQSETETAAAAADVEEQQTQVLSLHARAITPLGAASQSAT